MTQAAILVFSRLSLISFAKTPDDYTYFSGSVMGEADEIDAGVLVSRALEGISGDGAAAPQPDHECIQITFTQNNASIDITAIAPDGNKLLASAPAGTEAPELGRIAIKLKNKLDNDFIHATDMFAVHIHSKPGVLIDLM